MSTGSTRAADALKAVFGPLFVDQQAPVDVGPQDNPRNEPEPDVVVLRRPYDTFTRNPGPEDIALVVEVADTTLRADRTTKARLYARAGISEYWVLDVVGRRLFVYRDPADGRYLVELDLAATDSASALSEISPPLLTRTDPPAPHWRDPTVHRATRDKSPACGA